MPNNQIVSASSDKTIKIWNTLTGEVNKTLVAHEGPVTSLAVMARGQFASASEDKTIRVWIVELGIVTEEFSGQSKAIRSLISLPFGELVSGSDDSTARIWQTCSDCTKLSNLKEGKHF